MAHTSWQLRRHARQMRRTPTRAEDRLWSWLPDRRCAGLKFKRQVPIGRFIVDFFCAELNLAVELDGSHHQTSWMAEYDGERSLALFARGIRVLRIPNELLVRDSLLVGMQIRAAIAEAARAGHF